MYDIFHLQTHSDNSRLQSIILLVGVTRPPRLVSIASAYDYCWIFDKKLDQGEQNTKFEKFRFPWRRSRGTLTFFWERSWMDGKVPLQEHISVWEKLLYNINFLLIKFSRVSYTGLYLCLFLLLFQMLIKYFKINVLYQRTALSRRIFRHGFTGESHSF